MAPSEHRRPCQTPRKDRLHVTWRRRSVVPRLSPFFPPVLQRGLIAVRLPPPPPLGRLLAADWPTRGKGGNQNGWGEVGVQGVFATHPIALLFSCPWRLSLARCLGLNSQPRGGGGAAASLAAQWRGGGGGRVQHPGCWRWEPPGLRVELLLTAGTKSELASARQGSPRPGWFEAPPPFNPISAKHV